MRFTNEESKAVLDGIERVMDAMRMALKRAGDSGDFASAGEVRDLAAELRRVEAKVRTMMRPIARFTS